MAKKVVGGKNKVAGSEKPLSLKALQEVVTIYVFLLLVVYPIYYQEKYFNMGEAKWQFFKTVTMICAALAGIALFWYFIDLYDKKELKTWFTSQPLTRTDLFMLGYLGVNLISCIFTPYRKYIFSGYRGWYMGLLAQFCFVALYFVLSRFWRWDVPVLFLALCSASFVFIMGILMRFRIDPMEMYTGLKEMYIQNFISTLGQATWYSSYMVIIFPLGMFLFWNSEGKWTRILSGIFTAISFMTFCTQNSDSAYIALAAIFMVLYWVSVESNRRFDRFLQILIVCFSSFKFMGILRTINAGTVVELDAMSDFLGKSTLTWILLAASVAGLFLFRYLVKNKNLDITVIRWTRLAILIAGLVLAAITVIYIALNTSGALPENLRSTNNYLLFDNEWGNRRGSSWRFAFGTYVRSNFWQKLVGTGPDSFAEHVYAYFKDDLNAIWGDGTYLTCAHNEWLNTLVNLGLFGLIAYAGIFVTAVKRFLKMSSEYPEAIAVVMSICAYAGHNLFCYQQIICTPVIFLLMGCTEALLRRGYSRG